MVMCGLCSQRRKLPHVVSQRLARAPLKYCCSIYGALEVVILLTFNLNLALHREVTVDEMAKIICLAPAKHCQLDPAPTSLLKRLLPLLVPTFANMVNATLKEGVFIDILKHATVRPRRRFVQSTSTHFDQYRI